jgi:NADH:ubiquinone oxidoreductase subunit 3 (subunit A)
MDLLISLTILLAALATGAIFLAITRLLHPTRPPTDPTTKNSAISPSSPAIPPARLFLPALLYLLTLVLLALLTPLAILFPTLKLPTLVPIAAFLTLPALAYAYLWRFNHLTPPERDKVKR